MASKFTKPSSAFSTLTAVEQQLVLATWEAAKQSYSPYSKFPVGAAILAENDSGEQKVFTGCNVENASYGGTICAERTAGVKAVSEGYRKFVTVAVVCAKIPGGPPCGFCRQFLCEFGGYTADVLTVQNAANDTCRWTMDELLPDSFGPHSLH